LVELQKSPLVQIQLIEEAGVVDVDAALVRLARESGASLITVDHNLALVAEALRVPVAQVNALASRFRTPVSAGDETQVRLGARGPRSRSGGRVPRRRHDGCGRGRDQGDRVAGDGAGAQRDSDHHRSDDLRNP
jgi:hypothetical protein